MVGTKINVNSRENYVKILFLNRGNEAFVRPAILAKTLTVTTSAITEMLKRLLEEGYIEYSKYQGAKLTEKGETLGRLMVRRHRIWEMYLYKVLGFPWDKVHQEAERLEHASSDDLINRLEEVLGYPEFDPHGDPIPSKEGVIPKVEACQPLSTLAKSEVARVVRVSDFDDQFLNYISGLGIRLGQYIVVKDIHQFDESLMVIIDGTLIHLSQTAAQHILVHREKTEIKDMYDEKKSS